MKEELKIDYSTFKDLSEARIREAAVLFNEGLYNGAYYLAGYSIECALKAFYCKQMQFPPKDVSRLYNHNLNELSESCGLREELNNAMKDDKVLAASWGVASGWSEEARYKIWNKQKAEEILDAINNPQNGVLTWILKKL